jgi:hypothetical protein
MYKELYKNIIDNARKENRMKNQGTYYERHHIVPDFLYKNRKRTGPKGHLDGNPNGAENLILLTFSEHLMAHYYLYEIYKGTRYEYSAGSALQFFFVKATGNHKRQLNLSEVDEKFLKEMEHLRLLGNECISKARTGMMPVVDAITREKKGSVSVDHPKVMSGEWIHHSKGLPSKTKPENRKSQKGSGNNNYKELTQDRRERLWKCVANSCQEGYLKLHLLGSNMKTEFIEFNKISLAWIGPNFGSLENLVKETNENLNLTIKYSPYHRSAEQRKIAAEHSSKHRWYNNGAQNVRVTNEEEFCKHNPEYVLGRIKI